MNAPLIPEIYPVLEELEGQGMDDRDVAELLSQMTQGEQRAMRRLLRGHVEIWKDDLKDGFGDPIAEPPDFDVL